MTNEHKGFTEDYAQLLYDLDAARDSRDGEAIRVLERRKEIMEDDAEMYGIDLSDAIDSFAAASDDVPMSTATGQVLGRAYVEHYA